MQGKGTGAAGGFLVPTIFGGKKRLNGPWVAAGGYTLCMAAVATAAPWVIAMTVVVGVCELLIAVLR